MAQIVAAVRDIMFKARIQDAAQQKGSALAFVTTVDEVLSHKPDVLILDLNFAEFQPIESIRRVRQALPGTPRIICFASHVDGEIQEKARHAGADVVVPRSRFVAQLAEFV